jgi:ribosomal protein L16/L10AE
MFLNTSFKFRKNHLYCLKKMIKNQSLLSTQKYYCEQINFTTYKTNILLAKEYNAFRRSLGRKTEKLFRLVFFQKPSIMVTSKPKEMRMGKGKGSFSHVHLPVYSGSFIFFLKWSHCLNSFFFILSIAQAKKKLKFKLKH